MHGMYAWNDLGTPTFFRAGVEYIRRGDLAIGETGALTVATIRSVMREGGVSR